MDRASQKSLLAACNTMPPLPINSFDLSNADKNYENICKSNVSTSCNSKSSFL